jgi:hypothetical protein
MLLIKCNACSKEFWVKGHTTPGSFEDPGEVILQDCDPPDDACNCWLEGSSFDVMDEETEDFPDEN